jgi:hypothetical protein
MAARLEGYGSATRRGVHALKFLEFSEAQFGTTTPATNSFISFRPLRERRSQHTELVPPTFPETTEC